MFKKPKENRRVYAGRKKNGLHLEQKVPKLYDICIRLLINNIEGLFFVLIFLILKLFYNIVDIIFL